MSNDGPKPRETPIQRELREVAAAIDAEEQEWAMLGMSPNNVNFNIFLNVCRIDALIAIIREKELATDEEMDLAFKKKILETYQSVRQAHQDAVIQEKSKPRILGIDGRQLN